MSQEASVQTALVCSQCGRAFAQSDLVQIAGTWVCAECKPAFLSRVMATGAPVSPLAWRYGGFWIRFAARFVDGLVLGVPMMVCGLLLLPNLFRTAQSSSAANPLAFASLGITFVAFALVAGACYEILLLKYRSATVGKMACGLKVVRSDGRSLDWGVCFGRFFMWNIVTSGIPYLNFILMLISSIMAGVDGEKRALHDRVCDTRVIYKQRAA